jgi:hypothetical protein
MTKVELSLAESSYVTLLDARQKPRKAAADLIRSPLGTQIQNTGKQPYEVEIVQADAWLAICALSKSLDTDYETTSEVWARASVARKSGEIFWIDLNRLPSMVPFNFLFPQRHLSGAPACG